MYKTPIYCLPYTCFEPVAHVFNYYYIVIDHHIITVDIGVVKC